ncbi:MAG: hypothetical protein ACLQPH_05710 [Acidimicrobiales bacterium]
MHRTAVVAAAGLGLVFGSVCLPVTPATGAASPGTTTPGSLAAVSCPTLTFCVAVGNQGEGSASALVERWDGQRWKVEHTPSTGATDTTLTAVSCSSPMACTAVGYTQSGLGLAYPGTLLAERWNGSRWTIQSIPQPDGSDVGAYATGVSCPAVERCVAVGFYTVDDAGEHTVAADWNGSSWSLQSFPGYSAELLSVSCASAKSCVGAGDFGGQTASERWNGTFWVSQHPPNLTTPEPGDGLTGIGCTGTPSVNCQMVGVESTGDLSQATFGVGWDRSAWTLKSTPSPGEAASLSAVTCADASACVVVGSHPMGSANALPLIGRWDGTTWATQRGPPVRGSLHGVSCTTPTACTAVGVTAIRGGGRPLVERWEGTRWTLQDAG